MCENSHHRKTSTLTPTPTRRPRSHHSYTLICEEPFNFSGMFRGGSGEAFQLAFHGPGFVVVQPSEGVPVITTGS